MVLGVDEFSKSEKVKQLDLFEALTLIEHHRTLWS